jgi:hypothetical protein
LKLPVSWQIRWFKFRHSTRSCWLTPSHIPSSETVSLKFRHPSASRFSRQSFSSDFPLKTLYTFPVSTHRSLLHSAILSVLRDLHKQGSSSRSLSVLNLLHLSFRFKFFPVHFIRKMCDLPSMLSITFGTHNPKVTHILKLNSLACVRE